MVSRLFSRSLVAALLCVLFGAPAFAQNFQTDLGVTPLDTGTKLTVQGRGWVTATLKGNSFTVKGDFSGLVTPATEAHLYMGIIMGGRGPVMMPLTVTKATSGEVSGTVTLTPAQIAGLRKGNIYVQIDSEKAPRGNLWGWFQPEHPRSQANVPEVGYWYIPNVIENYTPPTRSPGVS